MVCIFFIIFPEDINLLKWDFILAPLGSDAIPPIKCVLGQLVLCNSKIGDKFISNVGPGLFIDWIFESGWACKGIDLALDV